MRRFDDYESASIEFMRRNSLLLLRWALAVIFVWFGALKLFDISPVDDLVADTLSFVPSRMALVVTGSIELAIGVGLLTARFPRLTLVLFFGLLAGTSLVIVTDPGALFDDNNPLRLTATGEFVLKNLVLVTAGCTVIASLFTQHETAGTGQSSDLRPRVTPSRDDV